MKKKELKAEIETLKAKVKSLEKEVRKPFSEEKKTFDGLWKTILKIPDANTAMAEAMSESYSKFRPNILSQLVDIKSIFDETPAEQEIEIERLKEEIRDADEKNTNLVLEYEKLKMIHDSTLFAKHQKDNALIEIREENERLNKELEVKGKNDANITARFLNTKRQRLNLTDVGQLSIFNNINTVLAYIKRFQR